MRGVLTPTGAVRAWWSLFMVLIAAVLVAGACVLYVRHVQQEADHRWCELFATLDRPVPSTIQDPVQRARSERAQQQFHKLRVELGCVKQ